MEFDTAYARAYEWERAGKTGWELEELAVRDWVTAGPVLDCPVGTGRFIPLWQEKGLAWRGIDRSPAMLAQAAARFPGCPVEEGDLLNLTHPDASYAVAVCVRLLPWLGPGEMVMAMAQLRRMAREVVVSVRVGEDGARCWRGSRTHGVRSFLAATEGMQIAETRITGEGEAGQFLILHLTR